MSNRNIGATRNTELYLFHNAEYRALGQVNDRLNRPTLIHPALVTHSKAEYAPSTEHFPSFSSFSSYNLAFMNFCWFALFQ